MTKSSLSGAERLHSGFALFSLIAAIVVLQPTVANAQSWKPAAAMATERSMHTATLLRDGRVLVAGGFVVDSDKFTRLATSEIYDPASNGWLPTPDMHASRTMHVAQVLLSGKVLIAGGFGAGSSYLPDTEVFDPATSVWSVASKMSAPRIRHRLIALNDGTVMAIGGSSASSTVVASAEIYDPSADRWTPVPPMASSREDFSATLLRDGRVLVAGGFSGKDTLATAEVYEPSTRTWQPVAPMLKARSSHDAVLLDDGKVLVTGGNPFEVGSEIFDPMNNTWAVVSGFDPRRFFVDYATIPLADGRVLVTGGSAISEYGTIGGVGYIKYVGYDYVSGYDPDTKKWTRLGNMPDPRFRHTATVMFDGTVLVAGGEVPLTTWSKSLASAYIYTPAQAPEKMSLTGRVVGSGSGTVTSTPAGISCGATCSASYLAGTTVTLAATPTMGSTFGGWTGACVGNGSCTVSMDAAKSVTATFTYTGAGQLLLEYYHSAYDHYFITGLADEIAKLDNGTFVGWARTGYGFKAYAFGASSGSAVCRFFSTSFTPKSSHFYTPFANECGIVKGNPDWQFEGEVFNIQIPSSDGTCPAGTSPAYRLYNNGKGAAPNHRYTTSLSILSQMIAQGWIPEGYGVNGVIMCAPN